MEPAPSTRPDPPSLGDYAVDGVIGEGGSSLVYAARAPDGVDVALKVLHPDVALSDREIERFLDEARKLAQVRDPGIVSVLASGRLPDGRPFIAMPRLRGRSLGDRLRTDALAPKRAIELFAGISSAVSALHASGLLHRDIKPDNVFWIEPEQRLVLLDLGIARDTEASPSTTTRHGLSRGTPDFMAPERLFGQRASVRTDVYELALLLYLMLARRPPWDEGDPQGRLQPKVDPTLAATIPPALVALLEDALALDVSRRPESIDALRQRIADATAGAEPRRSGTNIVITPGPLPAHSYLSGLPTEVSVAPQHEDASRSGVSLPPAVTASPRPRAPVWPFAAGGLVAAAGIAVAIFFAVRAPAEPSKRAGSEARLDAPEARDSTRLRRDSTAEDGLDVGAPARPPSVQSSDGSPPLPSPSSLSSAPTRPIANASAPASTSSASAPSSVPSASAPSAPSAAGMPPACAELVALMCDPTSGARPEECTAWKNNVDSWMKNSPTQAPSTCAAALSASQAGLANRRSFKP
jgi:serine/threonine protein kinase